jgi:hypothetical protein
MGLFDGREWTRDRRAEIGILGSEIDVLTPLLIGGTENPRGATSLHPGVSVCRVDRGGASLILVVKTGERYHLAVDDGMAYGVGVHVRGASGSSAWLASFPTPRRLETHSEGGDLIVDIDAMELTAAVIVAPSDTAISEIRTRMAPHGTDVVRFAEEGAEAYIKKIGAVIGHLDRLDALPDGVAVPPVADERDPSIPIDDLDARFASARSRARQFRAIGAVCRDYADLFVEFAAAEAGIFRRTVVTLPAYFSSFDVAAARRAMEPSNEAGEGH